mmetsp:Transcript_33979/g.59213  ORF Transcript_33979/g.59213 Transcript_33979/m.59213 type:complete len:254 (+) Transcript_33979:1345-2106(+)
MAPLSPMELWMQVLTTGVTNFSCLPGLYIVYKRGLLLHFYIGLLTLTTSFMYHVTETINMTVWINPGKWHKLDNIGSIMSLISVCVYLMDNVDKEENYYKSAFETRQDRHLLYVGMGLTLVFQTDAPWRLENTVTPIVLYGVLLIIKTLMCRPRVNFAYFKPGLSLLLFGCFCFYKGLDDRNDYLRIWHGCWHLFAGASTFFILQSIDKDRPKFPNCLTYTMGRERYSFWSVVRYLATLGLGKPLLPLRGKEV